LVGEPAKTKARRYPRIELPKGMLVAWKGGGRRQVSRVRTLALGGLYITTAEPPPAGTILSLVLELPGGVVRARATVRYTEAGKGMGISFSGMGTEEHARLVRLVKRLLG
jgi:hypothetical protein